MDVELDGWPRADLFRIAKDRYLVHCAEDDDPISELMTATQVRALLESAGYHEIPIEVEWDERGVQFEPKTERAIEAVASNPVAVEPAPASKAAKRTRKRQRRKLLSEKELTPIQIETYQIWAECKGNVSETARILRKDRKTVQETLDAAKTKLGRNATKHITKHLSADRRGQADVAADDDRRLA